MTSTINLNSNKYFQLKFNFLKHLFFRLQFSNSPQRSLNHFWTSYLAFWEVSATVGKKCYISFIGKWPNIGLCYIRMKSPEPNNYRRCTIPLDRSPWRVNDPLGRVKRPKHSTDRASKFSSNAHLFSSENVIFSHCLSNLISGIFGQIPVYLERF